VGEEGRIGDMGRWRVDGGVGLLVGLGLVAATSGDSYMGHGVGSKIYVIKIKEVRGIIKLFI